MLSQTLGCGQAERDLTEGFDFETIDQDKTSENHSDNNDTQNTQDPIAEENTSPASDAPED